VRSVCEAMAPCVAKTNVLRKALAWSGNSTEFSRMAGHNEWVLGHHDSALTLFVEGDCVDEYVSASRVAHRFMRAYCKCGSVLSCAAHAHPRRRRRRRRQGGKPRVRLVMRRLRVRA
jgi:hypothetical protein